MDTETTLDHDAFNEEDIVSNEFSTFRITDEGWIKLRNRLLRDTAIKYVFVALFMGVIFYYNPLSARFDPLAVIPVMIIFYVLLMVIGWFAIGKQRETILSLRLYIGPDFIAREHMQIAPLTIHKKDITKITFSSFQNAYTVQGKEKFDTILIPLTVNNSEQIPALLQSFTDSPITTSKPIWDKLLIYGILGLMMVSVCGLMFSNNKIIVAACAVVIIAFTVYSAVMIPRNPNVPAKLKWMMLAALIPFISFMAIAYTKLFSQP